MSSAFDKEAYVFATEVSYVHIAMVRAMAIIVETNVDELKDKLAAFHEYIHVFALFLHEHHDHEEKIIFPDAREKDKELVEPIIQKFIEFHEVLIPNLEKLIKDAQATPTVENAKNLQQMVQEFRDGLTDHFKEEEVSLDVRFYQKHHNRKSLKELKAKLMKDVRASDPGIGLPFVLYHTSPEGLTNFYNLFPWIFRKLLFPMFARRHAEAWQFAPNVTRNSSGKLIAPAPPAVKAA